MKKKFFASLASLVVVLGAVLLFNFMSTNSDAASLPRDCDTNSIINCGATTPDELKKFYKANKTGDLPAVYSHYGITSTMINGVTSANMGEVHKDGTITLGGKVVATGASSIGRKDVYKPSQKLVINGKTYYQHVPANTFAVESIKAFVFLDKDGKFIGAILTSCGNPFKATPKPVPSYKCDALSATKITREEYKFTAKATAKNGATITSYTYNFGDGKTTTSASTTASHTYAKAGTYTATLTVNFKVNGKTVTATSSACKVNVTVTPAPTPVYTCDSLTSNKISRAEYGFAAKATAKDGATITGYSFDFGDGKKQDTTNPTTKHTYDKAGAYTAKVSVNVKVNGATKTVTAASCQVKITIEEAPQPVYTCDGLTARLLKLDDRSYTYTLTYTVKNGAILKTVDYDFGDGQTKNGVAPADTKNVTHAYAKAGTYKTVATLHFNVNDTVKDVKCEASVTISPEMCELNPSLPKDSPDCAPCTVPGKEQFPKNSPECYTPCEVPGKEHLPKNSPDCYENCTVPGKETLPKDSPDCYENCEIPGKEQYPKGSDQCVETPVTPVTPETPTTPTELPHTGTTDLIGGMFGIGSLIAAGSYWFASRRNLLTALLNR
jgi:LPXTG-motif cell wall-anchored protein